MVRLLKLVHNERGTQTIFASFYFVKQVHSPVARSNMFFHFLLFLVEFLMFCNGLGVMKEYLQVSRGSNGDVVLNKKKNKVIYR